jgi:molecular chaperone GrpE (heat shock protein)
MRRLHPKKHPAEDIRHQRSLGDPPVARLNDGSELVFSRGSGLCAASRVAVLTAESLLMSWWTGKKSTDTPPAGPVPGEPAPPPEVVPTMPTTDATSPPAESASPPAIDAIVIEPLPPAAPPSPVAVAPTPATTAPVATFPDSSAVTASSTVAALLDSQQSLAVEQTRLRELFEARLRSDEVQNRALDRLLDELRDYKTNFVRQQQQPLLREIIDCHDFATRESQRLSAPTDTAPASSPAAADSAGAASLGILAQMLVDLLSRYDIEPFRHDGPLFDGKWQQCVKTIPCESPDRDKQVAELGASGFRQGDLIIRREQVVVYKYRAG